MYKKACEKGHLAPQQKLRHHPHHRYHYYYIIATIDMCKHVLFCPNSINFRSQSAIWLNITDTKFLLNDADFFIIWIDAEKTRGIINLNSNSSPSLSWNLSPMMISCWIYCVFFHCSDSWWCTCSFQIYPKKEKEALIPETAHWGAHTLPGICPSFWISFNNQKFSKGVQATTWKTLLVLLWDSKIRRVEIFCLFCKCISNHRITNVI